MPLAPCTFTNISKKRPANQRTRWSKISEIIDELEWMDDETWVRAKGKSDSMTTHIAYPDELLDDKKLIDLYQNVIIIKS